MKYKYAGDKDTKYIDTACLFGNFKGVLYIQCSGTIILKRGYTIKKIGGLNTIIDLPKYYKV